MITDMLQHLTWHDKYHILCVFLTSPSFMLFMPRQLRKNGLFFCNTTKFGGVFVQAFCAFWRHLLERFFSWCASFELYTSGRVFWQSMADYANVLMHVLPINGAHEMHSRREEAKEWLIANLSLGQRITPENVLKNSGISRRTIDRARKDLGVKSTRKGFGIGSYYYWSLPDGQTKNR